MLPQSNSAIILAASARLVVSKQHAGFSVITSFSFMAYNPPFRMLDYSNSVPNYRKNQ